MPKTVKLSKVSRDGHHAKDPVADHSTNGDALANGTSPAAHTGTHEFLSTSANEIFTGTDGVEDIFRFQLWHNNGIDTIKNFDVGEDKLILEWSAVNGLHASHVSSSGTTGTITAYEYGGTGPDPTTEIHVANLRAIDESNSFAIKFIRPDLVLDI